MLNTILLDNDIVLKSCAYNCHFEVVAETTRGEIPPSVLEISRFSLRTQMARHRNILDKDGASAALEDLLAKVSFVVPTQPEIELAAELEERATAQAFEFDTGESQLIAVLMSRSAPLLLTGDKRAIVALAGICPAETEGRVACLEQLIATLVTKHSAGALRTSVCAEPRVDKAMTACFACSATLVSAEDILAGLASYTNHLRKSAGYTLLTENHLLAVIT